MVREKVSAWRFPYFFVGTFIEARHGTHLQRLLRQFPYFFVGTFIEARF